MTTEIRNIVRIAVEVTLLAGVVLFAVLATTVGSRSVNSFSEQHAVRMKTVEGVEMTRNVIGYYELIDIVDFHTTSANVSIAYEANGSQYTCMFTTFDPNGVYDGAVRLVIQRADGEPIVYRRDAGRLYRNGVLSDTYRLEEDMKLPIGSMDKVASVPGNGMLGYEFTSAFFEWAREIYFVCTVTQTYGTSKIDSITIRPL